MQELTPAIYKVHRDQGSAGWGYSYLLKRASGNLLLARLGKSASIHEEFDAIVEAGGINKIYITDYHFAGTFCEVVSRHFDAPIVFSEVESKKISKQGFTNAQPFAYHQHLLEPDLEVIPTPGHTTGGVSYLWHSGSRRYLFTGDFLYKTDQGWTVGSKKWDKVEESVERIMRLDFDYLIGCGDDDFGTPYLELPQEARSIFVETLKKNVAH